MTTATRLEPGSVFARDFRVIKLLAEGGMGAVYLVEQLSTLKRRALKVVRPELLGNEKNLARFTQEAAVGSRIASEHIVEVIGAGVDETWHIPWLAMEFLEGDDLEKTVEGRGFVDPGELIELFRQLCHGLYAAHQSGIVHRDLKPENIFVARSRRADTPFTVKVLDFGIAKWMQENQRGATTSTVIGSPLWMAPEQIRAGQMSPATDVWALGLIAFWALTGKVYWEAANRESVTIEALLAEKLFAPIVAASQRAGELGVGERIFDGFDLWFARAVDRDPTRRYRHAGDAFAALESAAQSRITRPNAQIRQSPSLAPAAFEATLVSSAERTIPVPPPPPQSQTPSSAELAGVSSARLGSTTAAGSAKSSVLYALLGAGLVIGGVAVGARLTGPTPTAAGPTPMPAPSPPVASAPAASAEAARPSAPVTTDNAAQAAPPSPGAEAKPGEPEPGRNERPRPESPPRGRVTTANPGASPPGVAPSGPPGASSRPPDMTAFRTLLSQADHNEQLAAAATNPNTAQAYRQNAVDIRQSARDYLRSIEGFSRDAARPPEDRARFGEVVRLGRAELRRRGLSP